MRFINTEDGREILRPAVDYVFKFIFADERNKPCLTGFLSEVIAIPKDELELTVINSELLPESEDEKAGILDVCARTKDGKIINIEIQIVKSVAFFERISFYKSKLIIGQIKKGETYEKVKKTICIVITDFNLIENSAPDRYHHLYRLHDPADGTYFGDVEEVHLFELPRLPKTPDGSALWDWIAFIKAREEKDLEMVEKRNPEVKQAVKALYRMSADENLRYKYEVREKAWRDEQARLLYSRQEGLAEGLERGRQEGIERFILAARRMKACGMGAADIALCTGLSPEQIADL